MAREIISIDAGAAWTTLGVPGQSTVTIKQVPTGGRLFLNTTDDETVGPAQATPAAQGVTINRLGDQFSNTSATDQLFARATTDGWEIIFDQD